MIIHNITPSAFGQFWFLLLLFYGAVVAVSLNSGPPVREYSRAQPQYYYYYYTQSRTFRNVTSPRYYTEAAAPVSAAGFYILNNLIC